MSRVYHCYGFQRTLMFQRGLKTILTDWSVQTIDFLKGMTDFNWTCRNIAIQIIIIMLQFLFFYAAWNCLKLFEVVCSYCEYFIWCILWLKRDDNPGKVRKENSLLTLIIIRKRTWQTASENPGKMVSIHSSGGIKTDFSKGLVTIGSFKSERHQRKWNSWFRYSGSTFPKMFCYELSSCVWYLSVRGWTEL